ncbi:MAG: alpha/beta fold hydrolase [Armatimonadota bacterium]
MGISMTRRALLGAVLLLGICGPAQAQAQRFADLGDFLLESGETIRGCRIGYRTFGTLNEDGSNAVLFPSWFTGTSQDLAGSIGPGKLVDSSRYFVVAVDALGNGVSSSPSNSPTQPAGQFPRFTIRDMVATQHRLLTEVLKVRRLHAVVGISMGGMQAFQWSVSYPDFVERAVPIVGTPRQSGADHLLWGAQLRMIERAGSAEARREAMKAVATLHALSLWSPAYHVEHTTAEGAARILEDQERGALSRHPFDWAAQLRAMIGHDVYRPFDGSVERGAAAIRARLLIVVAEADHMVNPAPSLELAKHLKAETLVLTSDAGHLAPGAETARIAPAVSRFLEK